MSLDLLLSSLGPVQGDVTQQIANRFVGMPEVVQTMTSHLISWSKSKGDAGDFDVLAQAYTDNSFLEAIQRQNKRPALAVAMTEIATHMARYEPLLLPSLYRVFLSERFHSALSFEFSPPLFPIFMKQLMSALVCKPGESLLEEEPPLVRRLLDLYQQTDFRLVISSYENNTAQLVASGASNLTCTHPDLLPSYFLALHSHLPTQAGGFARLVQELSDFKPYLEKAFELHADPSFQEMLRSDSLCKAKQACGAPFYSEDKD